ncbi:hypothetical protein ACP26L_09435 [Paenibacillus sp. S-38]|uniref:hypothetical protein n=1 Tax=Paenibacillus sp. S-38 TaxID=3416710 RepID=UPI003CE96786
MSFVANVFFGSIEFTAGIVLALSMFRFQYYYYLPKIFGIALLMSLISFLFRDTPQLQNFSIIVALSIEIILIMIVYRIPFFYSLLVSLCGYIAGILIEMTIIIGGLKLSLFNDEEIQKASPLILGSVQITTAIVICIIIFLIQRRKIGFLFKTKNLSTKTALKGYNFVIASVLVIGLIIAQLELATYYSNQTISILVSLIMAVFFLIGILLAYKHNKKIIRETYERPIKDELDRSFRSENRTFNKKQL